MGAIIAGFAGGEGRFREVLGLAAGAACAAALDVAACGQPARTVRLQLSGSLAGGYQPCARSCPRDAWCSFPGIGGQSRHVAADSISASAAGGLMAQSGSNVLVTCRSSVRQGRTAASPSGELEVSTHTGRSMYR